MDETQDCTAKLADNVNWLEKLLLYFRPFKTHLSGDGFVLYKQIRKTLYVYAHGHFVLDSDGERRQVIKNDEYPYNN